MVAGRHARRLAFHGPAEATTDIFVMQADGSDLRPVTRGDPEEYQPDWSPDGQWLVYCAGTRDEYDLWIIRPDGTDRRRLTEVPGRDQNPMWRPLAGRKAGGPAVVLQ